MTNQEIFDKAVAGLAAQGFERSLAPDGHRCAYKAADGKRCAVGHLLTDEQAEHYDEACTVGQRVAQLLGWSPDFVRALQAAHDFGTTPLRMKRLLEEVARDWHLLSPPELTQ